MLPDTARARAHAGAESDPRTVTICTVPGLEPPASLIAALSQLSNIRVAVEMCPPSVAEWFVCPFIRDDDGTTYSGIEGIEYFIEREAAAWRGVGHVLHEANTEPR